LSEILINAFLEAGFHCKEVTICDVCMERVDLSVQNFTIKSFQVWAGKEKHSSSKEADFVKISCSEAIKKLTFESKICLEIFCLSPDIESRGRSRSCLW